MIFLAVGFLGRWYWKGRSLPADSAASQAVAVASSEAAASPVQAADAPINTPLESPQPEPIPPATGSGPMPVENRAEAVQVEKPPESIQVATAEAPKPESEPAGKTIPVEVAPPAAADGGELFKTKVQAVLRQYCPSCHGAEKPKGDFRVDTLHWPIVTAEQAEEWRQALDRVGRSDGALSNRVVAAVNEILADVRDRSRRCSDRSSAA
jgi:hypothetical protein